MRILDRYVIRQFLRIFLICVLGVPFLFQVIDLTDRLDNFLSDGVGQAQVLRWDEPSSSWTIDDTLVLADAPGRGPGAAPKPIALPDDEGEEPKKPEEGESEDQ